MDASKRKEVADFLTKVKFFTSAGGFRLIPRKKNLDGLSELGLNVDQAEGIILSLTTSQYVKGPEEDSDFPKYNMWEFSYDLNGQKVYIKISDNFGNNIVKCVSFHP